MKKIGKRGDEPHRKLLEGAEHRQMLIDKRNWKRNLMSEIDLKNTEKKNEKELNHDEKF